MRVPLKLRGTDVTLEAYCDDRHGFVRLTLTRHFLRGEYFAVNVADGGSEVVDAFSLDFARHRMS